MPRINVENLYHAFAEIYHYCFYMGLLYPQRRCRSCTVLYDILVLLYGRVRCHALRISC